MNREHPSPGTKPSDHGRRALLQAVLVAAVLAPRRGSGRTRAAPGPRIAVMAPTAVEILAALERLDRVVAVGDFVNWPAPVARLPRIGAYDAPNLEVLLGLRTDLLVTSYSEAAAPVHERLRGLGIRVLALRTDTWAETLEAIVELGARLHCAERAVALVATLRERMARVRDSTRGLQRRRTLVVVGRQPLFVAGPGSHLDELVGVAGGRNVVTGGATYQLISMEAVLERLPQVIVDTSSNRGRAGGWQAWPFLPAVRGGRVWQVHPERLTIPGPRMPHMAALMARLIHPERFGVPADRELGPLGPQDRAALEILRER